MFDMSWGEVMLIGGIALIVIGPKDLPKALRTVGQVTGKMRRMAGEFQYQFKEAVREAELDEVRREVDGIKRSAGTMGPVFDPVQTIRNEIKGAVEGGHAQSSTQPLANVAAQLAAAESETLRAGPEAAQAPTTASEESDAPAPAPTDPVAPRPTSPTPGA
ncbi:preprotein translocase subunit TatA [Methylobacterium sp. Leaf399]|uniref:Sec-independent protein translocase protein TatB n=1 Tax=Methylobacterium sp. Leaf399 TaxID=1736364 RepID=UPI0006F6A543|nr:Sec-independent protein translocase protein TatB [Methylobacterium sp. Leaf399]KQT07886.1 preprotein translocase subunit TatA [Methylobacterium sp. Leaf399]